MTIFTLQTSYPTLMCFSMCLHRLVYLAFHSSRNTTVKLPLLTGSGSCKPNCPKTVRLDLASNRLPGCRRCRLPSLKFFFRVMENHPPHHRKISSRQSVNLRLSLRPTAEKMEKNLQRICRRFRLTYPLYQYCQASATVKKPCLKSERVGSENRAIFLFFSLHEQGTVVFDGRLSSERKMFYVDALIFARDLLLHTVLAPSPCLCIVKRLGPDSPPKGLSSAP